MRRILPFAAGLLVAAGAGCLIMIFRPLIAASNSPLLRTSPASPSPSQSDEVYSGSQTCAFSTQDGEYSVLVQVQNTQSCAEWSSSLAGDGSYWTPVNGSLGATGSPLCTLDGNGGMTINVWDLNTDNGQGSLNTVASGVCQSMERDGWTPGTASGS